MQLLGVDTGGTFTDFVLIQPNGDQTIRIHKVLSTPQAPEAAILQGIEELGLQQAISNGELLILHGSTVATNAALEGKGVKTVYVANKGLKDVLSIGRQTRAELYNLQPEPPLAPVPEEFCLEIDCRTGADGSLVKPLNHDELATLVEKIQQLKPEAVAINLLFSFLNNDDEKAIANALPSELFCSISSFVLPEYKEYERGIATWLNAYLGPKVQGYLQRLKTAVAPCPVGVMQSSGGTIDADQASLRAVNLLLSGPAGGLAAAHYLGKISDQPKLMTFDMGGTSTDVAVINGQLALTNEGRLGPYPVAVPMVDMHTIGAGGGSIAYIDKGGMLQVGPESAGAAPGPACYGRGGVQATVTDANAVLGRLRPDNFLGGRMTLDLEAAEQAVGQLASTLGLSLLDTAAGIIAIANEHMARALRVISVQRGHDPQGFRLCCFGGAGGLHICALADALNMRKGLVPVYGGVLSALGMLVAPQERQLSHSLQKPVSELDDKIIQTALAPLAEKGIAQLLSEGVTQEHIEEKPSLDLRYRGQSYALRIDYRNLQQAEADFHNAHQERYGHALEAPVEAVNVRLQVLARQQHFALNQCHITTNAQPQLVVLAGSESALVYQRDHLAPHSVVVGPALICEEVSTTYLAAGWHARVDDYGNLLLEKD